MVIEWRMVMGVRSWENRTWQRRRDFPYIHESIRREDQGEITSGYSCTFCVNFYSN